MQRACRAHAEHMGPCSLPCGAKQQLPRPAEPPMRPAGARCTFSRSRTAPHTAASSSLSRAASLPALRRSLSRRPCSERSSSSLALWASTMSRTFSAICAYMPCGARGRGSGRTHACVRCTRVHDVRMHAVRSHAAVAHAHAAACSPRGRMRRCRQPHAAEHAARGAHLRLCELPLEVAHQRRLHEELVQQPHARRRVAGQELARLVLRGGGGRGSCSGAAR